MNPFIKKNKLKEAFKDALRRGCAVGQFNFSSLEQLQGIAQAAKELQTPVICGTSSGEAGFFGMEEAVSIISVIREREETPLFLNLDHGKNLESIKKAIDAGYDMVHFDGSDLPFKENIEIAREVVSYARKRGVVVEGEVSKISGKSTVFKGEMEKVSLTSLDKIVKFIKETGVDCVALDVGNIHGVYAKAPQIYPERVKELLDKISCFVVLHGGSGIKEKDVLNVIQKGVVKVNINTEIRLAWRKAIFNTLSEKPDEIVPYNILPFAREAVYEKVKEKIKLFNN